MFHKIVVRKQIISIVYHPSVINKLAGQTSWDATQMFSGFPLLKIAVASGFL